MRHEKSCLKSNFAKYVSANNHNIHFSKEKYLIIINKRKKMCLNLLLENSFIYNKVKHHDFYSVLNIQTDYLQIYTTNNNTEFSCWYFICLSITINYCLFFL